MLSKYPDEPIETNNNDIFNTSPSSNSTSFNIDPNPKINNNNMSQSGYRIAKTNENGNIEYINYDSDGHQIDNNQYNNDDSTDDTMYVTKRDGSFEEMSFDKITKRLRKLSHGLTLNATKLAQTVIDNLFDKIPSSQIDELSAEICASNIGNHPDYSVLASRIIISNHHKNTSPSFSETVQMLWDNVDVHGKSLPVVNERLYKMTMDNKEKINSTIDYQKDYLLDYFGFKTLERAYFLKSNGRIVERYQHLLMRVALGIHKDDLREALRSYKMMSEGYFTHATPTLFNVGTQHEQAFSCFLLQMHSDSIGGIYKTITDCALISKWAGGIGVAIHKIRAKGTEIRGTQGTSNGIVPMLKNFNETARYVDQGGGKRNGSFAMYIEPWHADIFDFLMLRRNTGAETERARDLFYAIWMPDLFMKRVEANQDWTLMCPDECPGLYDCYGDEFEQLYTRYEKEGRGRQTIKAQKLWHTIMESQIENGMPYITYKDAVNRKTNQKNLGTIQSSNLCNEITEYTSPEEHAVCCLLSVALPKFLENSHFMQSALDNPRSVRIYGKPGCVRCQHAKNMLDNRNVRYVYVNIDDMPLDKREATLERLSLGLKDDVVIDDPVHSQDTVKATGKDTTKPTIECDGDACKLVLPGNDMSSSNSNTCYTGKTRGSVALPVITIVRQVTTSTNDSNNTSTSTGNDDMDDMTSSNNVDSNDGIDRMDSVDHKQAITEHEEVLGGLSELEQLLIPAYNYDKLREVTKMAVRNLNKLIDYNYYPVPETETSNRRHRPIGIGIQGLADVFAQLKIAFDSKEAVAINAKIAEHMYLAAVEASMEIARRRKPAVQQYRRLLKRHDKGEQLTEEEQQHMQNLKEQHFIYLDEVEKLPMGLAGAYSSFVGSPAYEGKLQYDLWDVTPSSELADRWVKVKDDIKKHGMRNSLLMARMPTASTSQILGNNECMEPYTNNIFARKVLAGSFIIVNKHLIRDLLDLGLWSLAMKDRILLANGSVQNIHEIPAVIRNRYRTVWEMKQKWLIDHSAAAGPFICQTQSMNLFVSNPTFSRINKMHFYAWRSGVKTGVYYTRSKAVTSGAKFAVDANANASPSQTTDVKASILTTTSMKTEAQLMAEAKLKAEAEAAPDECLTCSA